MLFQNASSPAASASPAACVAATPGTNANSPCSDELSHGTCASFVSRTTPSRTRLNTCSTGQPGREDVPGQVDSVDAVRATAAVGGQLARRGGVGQQRAHRRVHLRQALHLVAGLLALNGLLRQASRMTMLMRLRAVDMRPRMKPRSMPAIGISSSLRISASTGIR
jgi:hypothetical protein